MATGEALLAHIFENPADTAARLVYADWLLERGDARGELIHLQCKPQLDEREQKRMRGLLRKHAKAWLGPVSGSTDVQSRVWDRGFLRFVRLENGRFREIREAVGHPAWTTVRTVDAACNVMAIDLLCHPVMRGVRMVTRLHPANLPALAMRAEPFAIEQLDVIQPDPMPQELRTPHWPGLPRLRVLSIGSHAPDELAWMQTMSIETLIVSYLRRDDLEAWLSALDRSPWKVVRFGIGHGDRDEDEIESPFMFARDDGGRFTKLGVRCREPWADEGLIGELGRLRPRSLTQLVIEGGDDERHAKVRAAAAHALAS
jgi:uncharacterized protein (TIGR02996 family)